jgi:hypothetical protein
LKKFKQLITTPRDIPHQKSFPNIHALLYCRGHQVLERAPTGITDGMKSLSHTLPASYEQLRKLLVCGKESEAGEIHILNPAARIVSFLFNRIC